MIFTLLAYVFAIILGAVAYLLPDWQLPNYIIQSLSEASSHIGLFNEFFPITALFKGLLLIIGFELVMLSVKLISGILSLIRGGGNIDL